VATGRVFSGLNKWDGEQWTHIGHPTAVVGLYNFHHLQVFDDGRGPALYLVGAFEDFNNVFAHSIIRWDGHHFEPLGIGVNFDGGWDMTPTRTVWARAFWLAAPWDRYRRVAATYRALPFGRAAQTATPTATSPRERRC
jgi:hypothetical protein